MAKWGEGDPRWIVEERPDATNVNNWHWSEKNASVWSKDKFKSLFEGMEITEPGLGKVTINEVTKSDGEAMVNNRKGKLIYFYEWVLKLEWSAILDEDPKREVKGTIEIPNLSEENDASEVDVNVSLTSGGSKGEEMKEYIRKKGFKEIQNKVQDYIVALKREYATDLILPTKDQPQAVTKTNKTHISPSSVEKANNISNTTNNMGNLDLGCKISTCSFTNTQFFKCRAEELYRALTQREMVVAFTRGDIKLEVEKGGKFEFFGGNISGEFQELVPNKQITQKWRFRSWPSGHYSTVDIALIERDDQTELTLTQSGIPSNDIERTKEGWRNYYWESIKRTFGFGAMLI